MKVFDIQAVNSINWDKLDITPLTGAMADDLIAFINRACKYAVRDWWREKGFHKHNKENYLTIKSNSERLVMPMANMARAIATCLKFNIYEPETVKSTYQRTQDIAVKLLRTLSYNYIANIANGWRAMPVIAECAMTGALLWDKLNKPDKMLFINMLDHAATELLDCRADFWCLGGESSGENIATKAVYNNSNRAKVLSVAALMMPAHERAGKWQAKAKFFLKAATAMQQDGMKGYNLNEEGLVLESGNINLEEMLSITHGLDDALPYLLFGLIPPRAVLGNSGKVYSAFNNLYVSRARRTWEPLYARKIDGELVPEINLTTKGKSDKGILMQAYLMDNYAYCFGFDDGVEVGARQWAETRMDKMQIRQKSHTSFKYYSNISGKNWAKEAKILSEAGMAYAMLYFKAAGAIKFGQEE